MSGYIGTQPVPQATQHRETFTATASQTTFATVGYTPQFVDVYLNGIHLLDTVDYTATNSSDVVLTTGAAASDVVEIISYTPFEVANQTFTGTTTVDALTATGAFTSLGIDDNAVSTAITIDGSQNVGIGTSSPRSDSSTTNLHVSDSQVARVLIESTNTNGKEWGLYSSATGDLGFYDYDTSSEAMRIDSSGNVIMGKTTADNTTEGFTFYGAADGVSIVKGSGQPLILNRLNNDGDILTLRKDSTTVGAISVTATGAAISLGGTSAANTLDDYEEGTWTPTVKFGGANAGMTYTTQVGLYTKVGSLVSAYGRVVLSAKGTSTGIAVVGGLPFTSLNVLNGTNVAGVYLTAVSFADTPSLVNWPNSAYAALYETTNAGVTSNLVDTNFVDTSQVLFTVTYRVA